MGDERSAIAGTECGRLSDAQISVQLSELVMAGASSEYRRNLTKLHLVFIKCSLRKSLLFLRKRNLDPRLFSFTWCAHNKAVAVNG